MFKEYTYPLLSRNPRTRPQHHKVSSNTHLPQMTFRLLDLPQEIQEHTYTMYYKDAHLELKLLPTGEMKGPHFLHGAYPPVLLPSEPICKRFLRGTTSLNIELTCKRIRASAQEIRSKVWTSFSIDEASSGDECPIELFTKGEQFAWLRSHITSITIKGLSPLKFSYPDFSTIFSSCARRPYMYFEIVREIVGHVQVNPGFGREFLDRIKAGLGGSPGLKLTAEYPSPMHLAGLLERSITKDYAITARLRCHWSYLDEKFDITRVSTFLATTRRPLMLCSDCNIRNPGWASQDPIC